MLRWGILSTARIGERIAAAARRTATAEVVAIASRRSHGTEVSFGDKTLKVKAIDNYDFSDLDICLLSAGGAA